MTTAMQKLHTAESLIMLSHLRNLLEAEGIRCTIRNQYLYGALGEIPATECWPELWVVDDINMAHARELLEHYLAEDARPPSPWKCPVCGEQIEGHFAACWQCGHACA